MTEGYYWKSNKVTFIGIKTGQKEEYQPVVQSIQLNDQPGSQRESQAVHQPISVNETFKIRGPGMS